MQETEGKIQQLKKSGYLSFICCMVVAAIMPSYSYFLPPFMVLWGVTWLYENDFRFNFNHIRHTKSGVLLLLFLSFYLWQIIGIGYSDDSAAGLERIIKRLSFFLFPLVLFMPGSGIIKNLKLILRVFVFAGSLFLVYCLLNALFHSITFQDGKMLFNPIPFDCDYENYFFSSRLTGPIHPTYFSIYLVLSLLFVLEEFFKKQLTVILKLLWLSLAVFLIVGIYLLSSRTGFIALIVLPVYLYFKLKDIINNWIIYGVLICISISLFYIVSKNERFSNDFSKITSDTLQKAIQQDVRVTIWNSAGGLIKENPVFGVGTGDVSDLLKKRFTELGYSNGYYDNLNAHNQLIEIQLENGIIGLIIFLTIFGYMLYISIADRNLIYGLYIIILLIFFSFETALNRLPGISFFSYFSFLLIYLKR